MSGEKIKQNKGYKMSNTKEELNISKTMRYFLEDIREIERLAGRQMPTIPRHRPSALLTEDQLAECWVLKVFEDGEWRIVDFDSSVFDQK